MSSYHDVKIKKVEIISITPKIAEIMLNKNEGNRKISPTVIRKYTKDMENGEWRETGQGIIVDETGKIIDGQHRLNAIMKSGITINTVLTTLVGDVPTIMIPLDIGKPRKVTDICGNDINARHIGVFNAIKAVYVSYSSIMDANLVVELKKQLDPIFDSIYSTLGIGITTGKRPNALEGITRIWANGVKCAVVTALLDNKPITIVKEFKKSKPKSICCQEYMNWDYEMCASGMGGGAPRIITDAQTFWGILVHKIFVDPRNPKNYKKHIEFRSEMQEILHNHFEF